MPTITMPQLGETVTEGTITRWLKQVGEEVSADELLFEVSTDKVDSEVPSPAAGTLTEILVQEGETVPVGTPLCVIGEGSEAEATSEPPAETASPPEGEAPADQPAAATTEAPASEAPTMKAPAVESPEGEAPTIQAPPVEESPTEAPPAEEPTAQEPTAEEPALPAPAEQQSLQAARSEEAPKRQAQAPATEKPAVAEKPAPSEPEEDGEAERRAVLSPVVRKLAKENNVDLSKVKGTGAGGRITREDVLAFVEGKPVGETRAPAPAAPAAPAAQGPPAPAPAPKPAAGLPPGARVEALSTIRQRIAEHMTRSRHMSAHVLSVMEVDMEEVERVRAHHKEAFREREGFGLTYLPFITRATVDALRAFPAVNASIDLEQRSVTFHDYVNIGFAVDLDEKGLIVPVVKRADEMTVTALARHIRELADKAHSRQLSPDDVVGSTFTITNPGPFGSYMSAPVINQPNVAILSTEAVEKRAVVINDAIAIRHRMFLCLSWDHRAFDGSTATKFLARVKENLESWDWEAQLS